MLLNSCFMHSTPSNVAIRVAFLWTASMLPSLRSLYIRYPVFCWISFNANCRCVTRPCDLLADMNNLSGLTSRTVSFVLAMTTLMSAFIVCDKNFYKVPVTSMFISANISASRKAIWSCSPLSTLMRLVSS